jgi:hypothetical protein
VLLSASFDKDGQQRDSATGTLSLYHADREVGEAQIKTQLGAFAVAGAGLYVGRHSGEAITGDYPGQPPYRFTGGTINLVAIDVSGELYVDLEREAALMLLSCNSRFRVRVPAPASIIASAAITSRPTPARPGTRNRCSGRPQPCWSLGREPTENSAPKGSLRVATRP